MTTRNEVWNIVYNLIGADHQEQVSIYEGKKVQELAVNDIVESIEELACDIEQRIIKMKDDFDNQEPDAYDPIRGHNLV